MYSDGCMWATPHLTGPIGASTPHWGLTNAPANSETWVLNVGGTITTTSIRQCVVCVLYVRYWLPTPVPVPALSRRAHYYHYYNAQSTTTFFRAPHTHTHWNYSPRVLHRQNARKMARYAQKIWRQRPVPQPLLAWHARTRNCSVISRRRWLRTTPLRQSNAKQGIRYEECLNKSTHVSSSKWPQI